MEVHSTGDSGVGTSVSEEQTTFECPKCGKVFQHQKGYKRHLAYTCPLRDTPVILDSPRVTRVPVTKVTYDKELDSILASVEHPYARWRLAKAAGVTQCDTFPILFKYDFKGSKSSKVSRCCPTSTPYDVMSDVLVDAKNNFQVEKIEMPKRIVIVDGDSEFEVSKYLLPTRQEARTNRPIFNVIETDTSLTYSLADTEIELENSLRQLSLDRGGMDLENTSLNSTEFEPR